MNVNILDLGAIADGETLNTIIIQNAIDIVSENGGGRVTIPQGTFVSGTIRLKSNVDFHLEHGACLKASSNIDDYNPDDEYPENWEFTEEGWRPKHFIICVRQTNVAITGTGVIDASGEAFFEDLKPFSPTNHYYWMFGRCNAKDPVIKRPGQVIAVIDSQKIKVKDLEFINSTCWTLYFHGCRDVDVTGVRIYNEIYNLNTDGIDIDTCENVTVSNCVIRTGDDCITLRCDSTRLQNGMDTCKNITITNCVLECAVCGFRIGVGYGKIRNATISNITVSRSGPVFLFMTSYLGDGEAFIENINISNVTAENSGCCFEIDTADRGYVNDVSISNFRAHTFACVKLLSEKKGLINNINFTDMHLISENADYPVGSEERLCRGDHLIWAKNANNLTFTNTVAEIRADFPGKWKGLTNFDNCSNVKINGGNIE